MAKIKIEGFDMGLFGGHLYLVFEDDSGREWVLRGGPEHNQGSPEYQENGYGKLLLQVNQPLSTSSDRRIDHHTNEPLSPQERGSREIDLNGRNAAEVWKIMCDFANLIHNQNFGYNPLIYVEGSVISYPTGQNGSGEHNSNSVIGSVLNFVGIDVNQWLPNVDPGIGGFFGRHMSFDFDYSFSAPNGDHIVNLGRGSQTITAGAGNQVIDGGRDWDLHDNEVDKIVFSGKWSDYDIVYLDASGNPTDKDNIHTISIMDLRSGSPNGTATIKNIELFEFKGGISGILSYRDLHNQSPTIKIESSTSILEAQNSTAPADIATLTGEDLNILDKVTLSLGGQDSYWFRLEGGKLKTKFPYAFDYEAWKAVLDPIYSQHGNGLSFTNWVSTFLSNTMPSPDASVRNAAVSALKATNGMYVANIIATDLKNMSSSFDYIVHVDDKYEGGFNIVASPSLTGRVSTPKSSTQSSIETKLISQYDNWATDVDWAVNTESLLQYSIDKRTGLLSIEPHEINYIDWANVAYSAWNLFISQSMTYSNWMRDIKDGHSSVNHNLVANYMLNAGYGIIVDAEWKGQIHTQTLITTYTSDITSEVNYGGIGIQNSGVTVLNGNEDWEIVYEHVNNTHSDLIVMYGDLSYSYQIVNSYGNRFFLTQTADSQIISFNGDTTNIFGDLTLKIKATSGNTVKYIDINIPGYTIKSEFHGGSGQDVVRGSTKDDFIFGHGGDDVFYWSSGNDYIYGGAGDDTYTVIDQNNGMYPASFQINLGAYGEPGVVSRYNLEAKTYLQSIENVIGSGMGDRIIGNEFANVIDGGAGFDYIVSGGGRDRLYGGKGDDTIVSGGDVELIDGGSGYDLAILSGHKDAWIFVPLASNGGELAFAATTGFNWVEIRSIETFQFDDGTFSAWQLMPQPSQSSLAFDELPDHDGILETVKPVSDYWMNA